MWKLWIFGNCTSGFEPHNRFNILHLPRIDNSNISFLKRRFFVSLRKINHQPFLLSKRVF